MAAVTVDQVLTARSFLFGTDGAGVAELVAELDRRELPGVAGDAVGTVLRSTDGAVRAELARAVQGLLEIDLADVLLGGWRKWTVLTAAARRTRDRPGVTEVVSLAEHTLTSTSEPSVDLLVGEVRVATVHLELTVELTLQALAATVRGGRLVALTGGSCEVAVALSIEQRTVASRKARVPLPLVVRLGEGVALLPAAGRSRAVTPPDALPPEPPTVPAIHLPPRARPRGDRCPNGGPGR
jgi:hypothetical protein